ncbi:MAG TPA: TetR/AcrR family transcriptional regulator, partial [Gemmatimonadales bacterium]|nr:TetR/AcrR family transcriptional regulator [Gemmatimonadales bacterium]
MTSIAARPDVRDRILDAALQVLRTEGCRHFTQPKVAAQAKVRQSHVTYYFPTRAELLKATADRVLDGLTARIAEAAGTVKDWVSGPLLEMLARQMVQSDHMRMFLAMIVEADRDPEVRALVVHSSERVRTAIARALGGPDADRKARVIQTTLWGLG